jgi:hypothetical protein
MRSQAHRTGTTTEFMYAPSEGHSNFVKETFADCREFWHLRAVFKPFDHHGLFAGIDFIDNLKQISHSGTFLEP